MKTKQNNHGSEFSIFKVYTDEIAKVALVSPEQEKILARSIKLGDRKAFEAFVEANLRLVVRITGSYGCNGIDRMDLINEGNLGLMKAIERFDPHKGGKLSTYASLWIKQKIRRAMDCQSRNVRLPVHVNKQLRNLAMDKERFLTEMCREPTDKEMATGLNISERQLRNLRCSLHTAVPLDAPSDSEEGSKPIHELIADEHSDTPYQALERKSMMGTLSKALDLLSPRDRDVLLRRFGLSGRVETLEQIGKKMNVTRERVRQIQQSALRKLRRAYERLENPLLTAVN